MAVQQNSNLNCVNILAIFFLLLTLEALLISVTHAITAYKKGKHAFAFNQIDPANYKDRFILYVHSANDKPCP